MIVVLEPEIIRETPKKKSICLSNAISLIKKGANSENIKSNNSSIKKKCLSSYALSRTSFYQKNPSHHSKINTKRAPLIGMLTAESLNYNISQACQVLALNLPGCQYLKKHTHHSLRLNALLADLGKNLFLGMVHISKSQQVN